MNSVIENISGTKKRLIFEIRSDVIEKEIQQALNEVRGRTKLPGFRPGKAPLAMLERRYGKELESEVLNRLVPEYCSTAVKDANLMPISAPVLENDYRSEFARKSDLKIILSVEVLPEIEGLEYKNLALEDKEVAVEENEINERLQGLLAGKGTYEPVERAVKSGDLIVADIEVLDDNSTYPDFYLKFDQVSLPEKFFKALDGKNKDETIEVTDTFPDDFYRDEFKGKTLTLKTQIKETKEFVVPEADDEFAKDVGFDSLELLREDIEKGLKQMKQEIEIKTQKADLIKELVDKYDFEIPENLLNMEIESFIGSLKHMDEYKDRSEESLKEKFKDEIARKAKAMIILSTIGHKEKISVSDNEISDGLAAQARALSMSPEALLEFYKQREGSLESLRDMIYREKVVDFVHSSAAVNKKQDSEPEKEESGKENE